MEDASALTSLPDDPQALKQIILNLSRERDDWHVKFLRVETELLRLRKWYYGPRADRLQTPGDVAQMLLAFATELEAPSANPDDFPPDEPMTDVGTVRRVRRGRRNLAAFDQLPVTRNVHDLAEADKPCPCCGKTREKIGEEVSWQVEFIPGRFERIEHVRIKYACTYCEQNAENPQITLADKPVQPIDKGMAHLSYRLAYLSYDQCLDPFGVRITSRWLLVRRALVFLEEVAVLGFKNGARQQTSLTPASVF
ncbi:MAG: IS66 family transposase zinc-finger binding domain-containing protein [Tepidisphaeraceae bacterium]